MKKWRMKTVAGVTVTSATKTTYRMTMTQVGKYEEGPVTSFNQLF